MSAAEKSPAIDARAGQAGRHPAARTPDLSDKLLEALPAAVYVCAADGTIVCFNRRAVELWGRAPSLNEPAGRFCGAYRMFRLDGSPMPHGDAPMAVVLRTGEPVRDREAIIMRPDGSRIVALINIEPLRDDAGRISGAVTCFVDISERKRIEAAARESERRLRATYERAFAGIGETGLDGRFIRLNARYCELTGHCAEELLGRHVLDVTHPDDVAAEREHFDRLVAGEIEHYQIEKRFLRKCGEMGWAEVSVSLVPGTAERPPYVIRVALDLSDRKRAEIHQRMLLDEVNHRVKNSLAAVKAIADQTRRSVAAPEQFYDAFSARLLAFSRAHDLLNRDAWRGALLDDILRETLAAFGALDGGRIHIGFRGDTAALRFVPSAALALGMVCHELATNAAKYGALTTRDGRVDVACAVTEETQPRVRIDWMESGGPPVTSPSHQGFGARFVQRTLAHQFDGAAEIDFAPGGVRCCLIFPISPMVIAAVGPAATINVTD